MNLPEILTQKCWVAPTGSKCHVRSEACLLKFSIVWSDLTPSSLSSVVKAIVLISSQHLVISLPYESGLAPFSPRPSSGIALFVALFWHGAAASPCRCSSFSTWAQSWAQSRCFTAVCFLLLSLPPGFSNQSKVEGLECHSPPCVLSPLSRAFWTREIQYLAVNDHNAYQPLMLFLSKDWNIKFFFLRFVPSCTEKKNFGL